jgi:hypothetical protein
MKCYGRECLRLFSGKLPEVFRFGVEIDLVSLSPGKGKDGVTEKLAAGGSLLL